MYSAPMFGWWFLLRCALEAVPLTDEWCIACLTSRPPSLPFTLLYTWKSNSAWFCVFPFPSAATACALFSPFISFFFLVLPFLHKYHALTYSSCVLRQFPAQRNQEWPSCTHQLVDWRYWKPFQQLSRVSSTHHTVYRKPILHNITTLLCYT